MTLREKLKRLLYQDSHAAEVDSPAPPKEYPPLPPITAEQIAGMDDMAEFGQVYRPRAS